MNTYPAVKNSIQATRATPKKQRSLGPLVSRKQSSVSLSTSSLPLLHQLAEVVEQVVRVVRPRSGFGWYCTLNKARLVAQAFERMSFKSTCVSSTSFALIESGSTAKLLIMRRDLHLAVKLLRTGWLPPWWPNLSL